MSPGFVGVVFFEDRTILEEIIMDDFARMRLDLMDIYRRRTLFFRVTEELFQGHFIGYNVQLLEHKQLNSESHHQLHVDVIKTTS